VDITKKIRDIYFVNKIVISGGCFQNRYLLDNVNTCLKKEGFEVYIPSRVPLNDGGISLGQAAIATLYSSES
jgi:hydrogenase maturation protein HypF